MQRLRGFRINRLNHALIAVALAAGCAGAAAQVVAPAGKGNQTGGGTAAETATKSVPAPAINTATEAPTTESIEKLIGSRTADTALITLRQLGAVETLNVWRTGGQVGAPFSVRSDEVITGARLLLSYSYSAQAVRQPAQLKVMLNGEQVAAIALAREQANAPLKETVQIDPRIVTDFNRISLQLESSSNECIEPGKGEPLLKVDNASTLELQAVRLSLPNELALLPLPFFDERDPRRLELPFLFGEKPSARTLEAASSVASWFGQLAGYRGAVFPAAFNTIPKGNAVAFVAGAEQPGGLAGAPTPTGPSVAVITNPTDDQGKLLIVMGRDARELKLAAIALSLGSARATGQLAQLSPPSNLKPRAAYDTANWIPTNRPVRLSELGDVRRFTVSPFDADPVRVNFRIPPDIFAWRSSGIPIDLRYRFVPKALADTPVLNVNVNGRFVDAIHLRGESFNGSWRSWFRVDDKRQAERTLADGTLPGRKHLHVPSKSIEAQSHFNLEYDFDYLGRTTCRQVTDSRVGGGIDPDSTIDFSGFPHYLPMPDLAAFGNAGFPFSRVADLSETAVIMPETPTTGEVSALLTVMGRMGESTGNPAISLSILRASEVATVANKDLLLIGSPASQPLIKDWAHLMTWNVTEDVSRTPAVNAWDNVVAWIKSLGPEREKRERQPVASKRQSGDAAIVGFESPLQPGRSVVALVSGRDGRWDDLLNALTDFGRVGRLQGSAVAIGADRVEPLSYDTTYYVGELPPLTLVQWYFSKHPVRLWMLTFIAIVVLSFLLHRYLSGLAARRLRGE